MENVFTANSLNELKNFLVLQETNSLCLKVFNGFDVDENGLEMTRYLVRHFDEIGDNVNEIVLNVPYEKMSFSVLNEFSLLNQKVMAGNKSLNVCVKHAKTTDVFDRREAEIYWDFNAIARANKEIDDVCNFLRKSNLSPFEMLAYIHDYVATIAPYKFSSEKHLWTDKDQFFVGAYQDSPEVVCVGYAMLMKEIIDNLNMSELQCEILSIEADHLIKKEKFSHARCLVKIKDKKYGLDQAVFDDATWDNTMVTGKPMCYAHFAMPNNSLEDSANGHYHYYYPEKREYENNKANFEFVDENLYQDNYNRSQNTIDQAMIETAYFNVIDAKYPDKSFDEKYDILKDYAKYSFEEQSERDFKGYFKSGEILLTKDLAKKLYKINHKKEKNDFNNDIEM